MNPKAKEAYKVRLNHKHDKLGEASIKKENICCQTTFKKIDIAPSRWLIRGLVIVLLSLIVMSIAVYFTLNLCFITYDLPKFLGPLVALVIGFLSFGFSFLVLTIIGTLIWFKNQ